MQKGKKIINRFDDMKNIASNRLEEWLEEDEDISQNLDFKQKSFYNNERTSTPVISSAASDVYKRQPVLKMNLCKKEKKSLTDLMI